MLNIDARNPDAITAANVLDRDNVLPAKTDALLRRYASEGRALEAFSIIDPDYLNEWLRRNIIPERTA